LEHQVLVLLQVVGLRVEEELVEMVEDLHLLLVDLVVVVMVHILVMEHQELFPLVVVVEVVDLLGLGVTVVPES
jgi:hypothetical protein